MKRIATATCTIALAAALAAALAGLAGCASGAGTEGSGGTTESAAEATSEEVAGTATESADEQASEQQAEGAAESEDVGATSAGTTTMLGLPDLQPSDHEGRFEAAGYEMCVVCHTASEPGGETPGGGSAIPADHFVDGDMSTGIVDPVRNQCITCHPVKQE